jgi:hypothetical protein
MSRIRRVTVQLKNFGQISSFGYDDVSQSVAQTGFAVKHSMSMQRDSISGHVVAGISEGDDTPAVIPSLRKTTETTAHFLIQGMVTHDSRFLTERSGTASLDRVHFRSIPGTTPDAVVAALAALAWPPCVQVLCC